MRQRGFGIVFLAAAMLGVLPATTRADQPSGNTNSSDNTPWNRRLDDARVDEIKLKTDRYDTVTEVVVITPDCAFRSDTRNINRRNVNRIGFTQDIPLIGGLFENTPRAGRLDGSNQIGLAYLDGNVLYIDTRSANGSGKAAATSDRAWLTALAKGPAGTSSANFAVAGGGLAGECQRRQSRLPICDPDRRLHRRGARRLSLRPGCHGRAAGPGPLLREARGHGASPERPAHRFGPAQHHRELILLASFPRKRESRAAGLAGCPGSPLSRG